jgi:mono/diheme cytochrome c family protein
MIVRGLKALWLWESWANGYGQMTMTTPRVTERRPGHKFSRFHLVVGAVVAWLVLGWLGGCDVERRRSDTELGLNPQQAAGRKIYDNYCDRCHRPYSTKGKKGPGLQGMYQHPYLSLTGLPANDDRVGDIVRNGRPDMPGYGQTLSQQDIQDLLAYLHTL